MTLYFIVKYLHVLGAIVSSASRNRICLVFCLCASEPRSGVRRAARGHRRDCRHLFTLTAVVFNGTRRLFDGGCPAPHLRSAACQFRSELYAVRRAVLDSVVFMRIESRLARKAVAQQHRCPPRIFKLFRRRWFSCSAFRFRLIQDDHSLWLMIAKPFRGMIRKVGHGFEISPRFKVQPVGSEGRAKPSCSGASGPDRAFRHRRFRPLGISCGRWSPGDFRCFARPRAARPRHGAGRSWSMDTSVAC